MAVDEPKSEQQEPPPTVEERLARIEQMLEQILRVLGGRTGGGLGH